MMGKLHNNEKGFGAVEGLLIIAVVVLIGVVGYMVYKNQHKTKTASVTTTTATKVTAPTKTATTQPTSTTSTTPSVVIKEWGIKIEFADASNVTYKIAGNPVGETPPDGSAQYVDSAGLYLLTSITTDPGCQYLGIGVNRAKPITAQAKASAIGGYVYSFAGGPGPCDGDPSGTINNLRAKITSQEIGSGKYTISVVQ